MIYLDNAATTAVHPDVIAEIAYQLDSHFGNPSSLYDLGLESRKVIDRSRSVIARSLGCEPAEVYFTSCGTESNNLAILGAARARKKWGNKIVVSGFEHPSVQNTVSSLADEGFEIVVVDPEPDGTLDLDKILNVVDSKTVLVCCMRVNNEVGSMIDTPLLAKKVKMINRRTAFHCDAVQSFLKHSTDLNGMIDTLSISAHKIHGPKGIGALYIRKGFNISSVQFGGGQEKGLRSGTENVPYAAGFAKAVELLRKNPYSSEKVQAVQDRLWEGIRYLPGIIRNSPDHCTPFILNISVCGIRSETVLHFLEERGIYVSSGSACSHGARSHTLEAMGINTDLIDSAIRFSFDGNNNLSEIDTVVNAVRDAVNTLERRG